MKIALERVDARGIDLDAGGLSLRVADAANLRGQVVDSDVVAKADALLLAAFSIALGDLLLQSATGLRLEGLSLATKTAPHLAIEASAAVATTDELIVTIDDIIVRGRPRLEGVRLEVRGDEGSLAAERVLLEGFALTIGALALTTPRVTGTAVHIAWGRAFRLNARTLAAEELEVAQPGVAVRAANVGVTDLAVHDGISVDRTTVERAEVDLTLGQGSSVDEGEPGAPFVFDWGILDFLSGRVDVDVHVDIAVPVIGRRKATHRLRVPIENGIIDYRELERNLANLENALLDFAVREEGLALERVNPIFPMRGHGKPIVVWPLGPEDRALAERDHVRLALLSSYEMAGPPSSTSDEPSAISLKKLDLLGLTADLSVAPVEIPLEGPLRLRHVERLELRGELHDHGPGSLAADVSGLALSVRDLGGLSIDLASAVSIRPISIAFADLRPTEVRLVVEKLALDTLATSGA